MLEVIRHCQKVGIEITAHNHVVILRTLVAKLLHRLLELDLVEPSFASDRKYTIDQDDAFSNLRIVIVMHEGTEGVSELLE